MVKHPENFFAQPSNDQMQVLSARLGLERAPIRWRQESGRLLQSATNAGRVVGAIGARRPRQWTALAAWIGPRAERHRFTLGGTDAHSELAGRRNHAGIGDVRNEQFRIQPGERSAAAGRWEAFLTPNLLAVTEGSLGRTIQTAHAEPPSAFEQPFLAVNAWGQLPQMVVDSRYGFSIGNPSRFGIGSYPDEHRRRCGRRWTGSAETCWSRRDSN